MSKPAHIFQLPVDGDGGAIVNPNLQTMEVWYERYKMINLKEFIRQPKMIPSMGVVPANNNEKR